MRTGLTSLIIFVTMCIVLLAMSGCTGTQVFRVIEYGGGGAAGLVTGEVAGCAVHQTAPLPDRVKFDMMYAGEKCVVRVVR